MDFNINSIASKFKNPTFIALSVGVGGFALFQLFNKSSENNITVAENPVYSEDIQGYTTEDVKDFTESVYYTLAETVGEGFEDLGNILIENQNKSMTNLQDVYIDKLDDLETDFSRNKYSHPTPVKKTRNKYKVPTPTKSSKKYVKVKYFTGKNIYTGTLGGIAEKAKISLNKILKLNPNIKNKDIIQVGQKIRVK